MSEEERVEEFPTEEEEIKGAEEEVEEVEEKPKRRAFALPFRKKEEEEIVEEREMTINLRRAYLAHGYNIAPRAVRLVKKIVTRHLKVDEVKIMPEVNQLLWSRSKRKVVHRVKVKVVKTKDNIAKVYLAEASS